MEVNSVSKSSLSNVELSRSEKKKIRKQRKHQAFENRNVELKLREMYLGTDSDLGSEANVSLDSRLREGENSSRKDGHLETEQLTCSRREKRKRKGNCLIDESKVNVCLESGLKEEPNSLMKDTILERDSYVETVENVGSVSGLKGSQLNEQPVHSKRKRKLKKQCKMANGGQFEKLDQKSAVELRDGKKNSFIDEKRSDSHMESKVNVSLLQARREVLGGKLVSESGLKEGGNSLMKDNLLERDSHVETSENISIGSGLKGSQLNEQPADRKRKRKRKRECKMGKAGQFEKLDTKSVLELRDRKENSLIDEKKSDSHLEFKMNVSLESGLEKGANSDVGTLENISLESGLKGTQLTEEMVQSERKRKRNREKRKRNRENRKKRRISVLEDNDISSKRNERGNNEPENNNMYPEPQITNRKDFRKEDLMSISENVDSKNMKKNYLIPDKQSDSPRTASASTVKTQDLHVDGDLVMPEVKDNKTFQIGKMVKTYHRKRKKSSDLLGDSLEPVPENGIIRTSIDHLEKERTTGFLENRPDGVVVGEHAMPAQVLEEAFSNSTGSEVALKGRKRKKRKKLKESSNLAVAKDDVALKATVKEKKLSRTLYTSLERICISRPKKKLLVLDLNGILVDVVQNAGEFKPDIKVAGKGVFKRPFCDDFLNFCFSTFNVGIWSSRISKNVDMVVAFLMRKWRHNLLFCWHRKQCTITKYKTIEDKQKPLVFKELRKLWEKHLPNLPWEKGDYDESNTLLLDDSPYKALRNPANTAVFPYPYHYRDAKDHSLACGGDIRQYLERIAAAENVQKYVEQNPFGQPAITESNPHWDFYCQTIEDKT